MSLSDRLNRARTRAGVTGADLGLLAGLSRGAVSMIESGHRPDPNSSTVVALAGVLGVSLAWLLGGEGAMPAKAVMRAAVEAARAKKTGKSSEGDAA
jgi:transcriptional regulator with XRE-family HTH domain